MEINYSKPVVNEDGTILVEQVSMLESDELPNGIKRRELKVIQELYPNMELLKETIERARTNYNNVEMQGHKSVAQLEQEKASLEELANYVDEL